MTPEDLGQATARREISEQDIYAIQPPSGPFDRIIDIGANRGLFATFAHFHHPESRVVALEPDQETFRILKDRTSELGIECHRLALGDGNPLRVRRGETSLKTQCVRYGGDGEAVPSLSLPDILDVFTTPTNRVMVKINIMGGEKVLFENPHWFQDSRLSQVSIKIHGHLLDWDRWMSQFDACWVDEHRVAILTRR